MTFVPSARSPCPIAATELGTSGSAQASSEGTSMIPSSSIFGSHCAASIEFWLLSAAPRLRLENLLIILWFSTLPDVDLRFWRRVWLGQL